MKTHKQSESYQKLTDVRAKIDSIDGTILRALAERLSVIEEVKAFKAASNHGSQNAIRPGREIQLLRRLMENADDIVPPKLVLNIWREMIGWAVETQSSLKIHVPVAEGDLALWDLARNHFSDFSRRYRYEDISKALDAATRSEFDLVILPTMGSQMGEWLEALLSDDYGDIKIAIGVPLIGLSPQAYIAGQMVIEDSGEDRSLFAATSISAMDGQAIIQIFEHAGFKNIGARCVDSPFREKGRLWFIGWEGFYDDAAQARLPEDASFEQLKYIGGYPVPIFVGNSVETSP